MFGKMPTRNCAALNPDFCEFLSEPRPLCSRLFRSHGNILLVYNKLCIVFEEKLSVYAKNANCST